MELFDPRLLDVSWDDEADAQVEQEEEVAAQPKVKPWVQAILVAVDVHDLGIEGNVREVLRMIEEFVKQIVRESVKDLVGVVLYGSLTSQNEYSVHGISRLNTLGVGVVELIQVLKELQTAKDSELQSRLQTAKDVRNEAVPLSHLFRYALREFRVHAPGMKYAKRLVLFTNRDDPCAMVQADKVIAAQLANDLLKNGALVDVFPTRAFDWTKFWLPIVHESETLKLRQDTNDPEASLNVDLLNMSLESQKLTYRSLARQRTYQKTRLRITHNTYVGVNVFIVLAPAKVPYAIKLRGADHKPIASETQQLLTTTGEVVARHQLVPFMEIAGVTLDFTEKEILSMKSMERETGEKQKSNMCLLGFTDNYDRYRHSIKDSVHYVYASNEYVENSRSFFAQFVEALTLAEKYAVIGWRFRANSAPRLYCAVPNYNYMTVPGLFLLAIPYLDDLRTPWLVHEYTHTEIAQNTANEAEKTMEELLAAMAPPAGWNPQEFTNPAISKFWHGLESIALEEVDSITQWEDDLVAAIRESDESEEITALGEKLKTLLQLTNAQKRSASSGRSSPKKAKVSEEGIQQLRDFMHNGGDLSSKRVVDLKAYLEQCGLKVSGNKGELIERLQAFLSSAS